MKKLAALFLSVIAVLTSFNIQAIPSDSPLPQENSKGELTQRPEFKGGEQAFYEWLYKRVEIPEQAENMGVSGQIDIGFTVKSDGMVCDVFVKNGLYPLLDAEFVRLYKGMPKWSPGKKDGVAVNTFISLPIRVNKVVKPYKINYALLDKTDLSDMLTDAIQHFISKKYMGDLKIAKGQVKDNEGEVQLELTLKQKPEWWDELAADGTLNEELFQQTVWPMSPDFKTACMEKDVTVKCSIKPEKNQEAYQFDVKGDLWKYNIYDPSKKENKD